MKVSHYLRAGVAALVLSCGLAAPLSAAVNYQFDSDFGTFSYTTSDFITADRFLRASELGSCTPSDSCLAVRFDLDYDERGQWDNLVFTRGTSFGTTSNYYYFDLGAFQTVGIYASSGNSGTLTVSGFGSGAVPEPSAWALMILGFGTVGAGMRRRVAGVAYA